MLMQSIGNAIKHLMQLFITLACTAAGVTAGLDLAPALVEEDLGRDIAMAVANQLVMCRCYAGRLSEKLSVADAFHASAKSAK